MDRRRQMPRRLGAVLLLVLMAALVGMLEGDGFAEGDTAGVEVREREEGVGKAWWRWWVEVLSASLVPVIAGATLYVMFRQKKMGEKQSAWEREFGERQLKQERELTERAEWLAVGEKRHAAVKAAWEFLIEGVFAEKVRGSDKARFFAEVGLRGGLFGEKEEKDLKGLGDKVGELNELQGQLREERGKVRGGAGSAGEVKKLEKKREALLNRVTEVLYRLGKACWERRGS